MGEYAVEHNDNYMIVVRQCNYRVVNKSCRPYECNAMIGNYSLFYKSKMLTCSQLTNIVGKF